MSTKRSSYRALLTTTLTVMLIAGTAAASPIGSFFDAIEQFLGIASTPNVTASVETPSRYRAHVLGGSELVDWAYGPLAQTVGSFPDMNGGFEEETPGTVPALSSIATGAQSTSWTVDQTIAARTINASGGRSGPQYVTLQSSSSSARRFQSPTVNTSAAVANSTAYTVQFYYRTPSSTGFGNGQVGVSPDGTTVPGAYQALTLAGTSNVWTKVTQAVNSGSSPNSPRYGIAIFRMSGASGTSIDVDDFVVYAGGVDTTAPTAPTSAFVGAASTTSLPVSWTAPSGGVDGGGYLVVRGTADPSSPPNTNGIYKVGGNIAAGNTVVCLTTNTTCTDTGLTPGTQYFYRIYAVDKAFNYSSGATATSSTLPLQSQAPLSVNDPGAVTFGQTPTLTTSGGSGTGAVTFSSTGSTGCSVTSAGVLSVTDATGTCSVTATKASDGTFAATTSAARTIQLAKAGQTVAFSSTAPSTATVGGATYSASATGGASGNGVSIASTTTSVCTGSGSNGAATITFIAAGTCTIQADQAGNNNYSAAPSVQQSITIAPAPQTAALAAPTSVTYSGSAQNANAACSGGGIAGNFRYTTGSTTTSTVTNVGSYTVTVDCSSNGNFAATTNLVASGGTFSITPAGTTILGPSSPSNPSGTSIVGEGVTFQAALQTSPGGTPLGGRQIEWRDGTSCQTSTLLSTQSTSGGGSSTFITSTLAAGTHQIWACFIGETNYSASSGSMSFSVSNGYQLTLERHGNGAGTVSSTPAGIDCGATCSSTYASGTSVTLSAAPGQDSDFTGWGAPCSGTGTCTVTMDQARTVAFTFTLKKYTVTVSPAGTGTGNVLSTPAGIDCPSGSACSHDFDSGSTVVLTATAASGSTFTSWNGCDSVSNNKCTLTVNQARTATPTFTIPQSITIGALAPSSNFNTVNVGSASSAAQTTVTGTGLSSDITCSLALSGAPSFKLSSDNVTFGSTATLPPGGASLWVQFAPVAVDAQAADISCVSGGTSSLVSHVVGTGRSMLTVHLIGSGATGGRVAIEDTLGTGGHICDGSVATTCTYQYTNAIDFSFNATAPGAGVVGRGWSGDCTGQSSCSFSNAVNHDVSYTFVHQFQVSVAVSGGGHVGIAGSAPTQTDCRDDVCTVTEDDGQAVNINYYADAHNHIASYGGACATTPLNSACHLNGDPNDASYNTNQSASVTFHPDEYALSLTQTTGGTITATTAPNGIEATTKYQHGTQVTIHAAPASGYTFSAWNGDCAGQTGDCIVTMDNVKSVSATFTASTPTFSLNPTSHDFGTTTGFGHGRTSSVTGSSLTAGIDCTYVPTDGSVNDVRFNDGVQDWVSGGQHLLIPQSGGNVNVTLTIEALPQGPGDKNGNIVCTSSGVTGSHTIGIHSIGTEQPAFTTDNYSPTINVTFGPQPILRQGYPTPTVTINSGDLPTGITLDSNNNLVGTPTVAGEFPVSFHATNVAGSQDYPVTFHVQQMSIGASSNPATVGSSVTLTATLTRGAANGSGAHITITEGTDCDDVNATVIGSGDTVNTANNGTTVQVSTSSLALGDHHINACYAGNPGAYRSPAGAGMTLTVAPPTHTLTVLVAGQGQVLSTPAGIDCGSDCSESFAEGQSVALDEFPVAGWHFTGFTGDIGTGPACGTGSQCVITMDADRTITANFAADPTPTPTATPSPTPTPGQAATALSLVSDHAGDKSLTGENVSFSATLSTAATGGTMTEAAAPEAQTTAINWGTPSNITADNDVSTVGTLVSAVNVGTNPGEATTVNGVVFKSIGGSGTSADGVFTLTGGNGFNGYGSTQAPFSGLSNSYRNLLSHGNYGSGASLMTLTLNNLLSGHTYSFQVWINDSRGDYGPQTVNVTADGSTVKVAGNTNSPPSFTGGTGQYVIGTFTAGGTSQTITFQGDPAYGTLENAFMLRELQPGAGPVAGKQITFHNGDCSTGATIGQANTDTSGVATISTSSLDIGQHTITACFAGDPSYTGATATLPFNVHGVPAIVFAPTTLPDFGSVKVGEFSATKSSSLTIDNVDGQVTCSYPNYNFRLSKTGLDNDWEQGSSLTFTPVNGHFSGTLYVQFSPQASTPGLVSGIPITCSDGHTSADLAVSGTDIQPPVFTTNAYAVEGQTYGPQQLVYAGFPAATCSRTGGESMPDGLTLGNDCILSGTPSVGTQGVHHVTIRATNGVSPDAEHDLQIDIFGKPVFTNADHTSATEGVAFSFPFSVISHPDNYWALAQGSDALPSGVTFNVNTGTLSGTPAAASAGTYHLNVQANNGYGISTQNFILTVAPPPTPLVSIGAIAPLGTHHVGTSAVTSTSVTGSDLTSDITCSVLAPFSLSNSQAGTYGSNATFGPTGGTLWISFTPDKAGDYQKAVSCSSTGAAVPSRDVTGTGQSTLHINILGSGTGTVSLSSGQACNAQCASGFDFTTSSVVTLTPSFASDIDFDGFGGDVSCDARTHVCTVSTDVDRTVSATFTKTWTVTSSVTGTGGSITPLGAQRVRQGSDQTFDYSPNQGYHVSEVLVDGAVCNPCTSSSSKTFSNVTSAHSIAVSFASDNVDTTTAVSATPSSPVVYGTSVSLSVTVSSNTGGTIPTGTVSFFDNVACGTGTPFATGSLGADGKFSSSISTLSVGNHTIAACYGGDATHTPSSGTTLVTVTAPVVSVSGDGAFGAVDLGQSSSKLFSVTAQPTPVGDMVCGTTTHFRVSYNGGAYGSSVTLPPTGGNVSVQFTPDAAGDVTGSLTCSTGGAADQSASLSGTGRSTISITTAGDGGGTVKLNSQSCGASPCTFQFTTSGTATVEATPDATSTFVSFSGPVTCSNGVCTVSTATNAAITATFTKSSSVNFGDGEHIGTGSYHSIVITGGTVTLDGDITLDGCITVKSGATLVLGTSLVDAVCVQTESGSTLKFGSAAGFNGNLHYTATGTFSDGTSFVFNGTGNQVVGAGLPPSVSSLVIDNHGDCATTGCTVTGNPGQVVTGDLSVLSGVYSSHSTYADVDIAPAGTLSLSGNATVSGHWNNQGTFVANGFGITLNGNDQTITGNTTFYDLSKSTAGKTLTFAANSLTTVSHSLSLSGSVGSLMKLHSSAPGTHWNLHAPATTSISYVDVQDSDATGSAATVQATNSNDSLNNTNWNFVTSSATTPTISISPSLAGHSSLPVDVPVDLSNVTGAGLKSMDLELAYDPTVLTPVYVYPANDPLNPTMMSVTPSVDAGLAADVVASAPRGSADPNNGKIYMSVSRTGDFAASGTAFTLHFTVNATAHPPQYSDVSFTQVVFNHPEQNNPENHSNGRVTLTARATTTTVTSGPANPTVYGTTVGLSATVVPTDGVAPGVVSGTVTFKEGSTTLCSSAVVAGAASCNAPDYLNAGTHTVIGYFTGGGPDFADSASAGHDHVVTQASSTVVVTCPTSQIYTGSAIKPCSAYYFLQDNPTHVTLDPNSIVYQNNTAPGTNTASAYAEYIPDGNHTGNSNTAYFSIITNSITGSVTNAMSGANVGGVTIVASGTPSSSLGPTAANPAASSYSLTNIGFSDYTVAASKATQVCGVETLLKNGIDSMDATLVQRYAVHLPIGIDPLDPRYPDAVAAMKAAGFDTVSSFDATMIARATVGLCDGAALNRSGEWIFRPSTTPFATGKPLSITQSVLATELFNNDPINPTALTPPVRNFKAVLMGDVDGSWNSILAPHRPNTLGQSLAADAVHGGMPETTAQSGTNVSVPFLIGNLGGRNVDAYQFDVRYDPTVVTPQEMAVELSGTNAANMSAAFNVIEPGLLKVAIYGAYPANGDGAYANINFTVNGAAGSATELTVDSFLVNGGKVETNVENGRITVESAANNGSRGVSGRLVTIDGAGLRNAAVIITDSQGRQARVTSTSFGWFRFDGLSTGETYTLRVDSKHYSFQQRTFTIGDGFMSLGNIVADK